MTAQSIAAPRPPSGTRAPTPTQAKIIDTATQHPDLSCRQIGAIVNTDHAHVVRTLQQYGITKERVDAYKLHRAEILAGIQSRVLSSITDEDIKQASLMQRMASVGIAYDKERIERGLSTEIHDYRVVRENVLHLDIEIRRLESELSRLPQGDNDRDRGQESDSNNQLFQNNHNDSNVIDV